MGRSRERKHDAVASDLTLLCRCLVSAHGLMTATPPRALHVHDLDFSRSEHYCI